MKTFEKEVKRDLDLKHVKVFNWKFPKIFSFIGGFINPIFSFFVIKNKSWKSVFGKSYEKEVVAHEMMHLFLLNNGWRAMIIIAIIYLTMIQVTVSNFLGFNRFHDYLWVLLVNFSAMSGLFTYFEYDTIESTRKYARFKGFKVRPKEETNKMYKTYLVIYWTQFVLFYSIATLIELFIRWIL